MTAFISVDKLTKRFGNHIAVDNVTFRIVPGDLVGLLGPNGSGKTTVLNMMSGLLRPDSGSIDLEGVSIAGLTADRVARSGMIRMFQLTRVYGQMTVLENLLTSGFAMGLDRHRATERADELLGDLNILQYREAFASDLSGGQQKLLEFACCFMRQPKIALLDEPFAAIHPTMRQTLADYIRRTNEAGQAYLIVSHDMPVVKDLCSRAICLAAGSVLADGPTDDVLRNPAVIEAYLGPNHA
jgi:branched-chain amino acid transport system ATP-binding protein